MGNLKDINYGIGKYVEASDATALPAIETNRTNIDLMNFKIATNNAYEVYNFKDGMIDAYQTTQGVDLTTSTNEIYNNAGKYFSGAQAGNYFGDGSLGDVVFGASSITQTNDTVAIDTKLSTGSEAGGPGTNSYGFSAQGCTTGNDPPCPDTVYYVPNSTATYELTVPNTNGSYDGDMTYAQFNTLTINASVTLTTKQPGRGLFVFVKGDCTINGSLCMTARGGASNPTASGGSDSSAVPANGLQLGFLKNGATNSFTNDGSGFAGSGTGIKTILANQPNLSSDGQIFTIQRVGANGGASKNGSTAQPGNHGSGGTSGTTIITGGGGSGGIAKAGGAQHGSATSGVGGKGGCFSGGPSGGAACIQWDHNGTAGSGTDYGGAAGNSVHSGNSQYNNAGGGAGAPRSNHSGGTNSHNRFHGADGSGGLLWLAVGGDLTIASGATLEAKGGGGGQANSHGNSAGGAGSGGGAVMVLYHGTYSNSGSISTGGGSGGSAQGAGGNGGGGGTNTTSVDQPQAYDNMTLVSNAQTAAAAPTTGRLMIYEEAEAGTITLDTDLKGWVSRDGGTTYTQTPLTVDATYETGKRLISGSVDISGQPAGTEMKYKIETLNQSESKICRLHGASMLWA